MTKFQKKVVGAIATASLLMGSLSPVVFAGDSGSSYEISGNGRDSASLIDVELEREVEVKQENNADVDNDVTIQTNTGANKAKDNIGADVSIDTGDTEVGVSVNNNLNTNYAEVDTCGDCAFDGEFKISGNGRDSDNTIKFDSDSGSHHRAGVDIDQSNDADVSNDVDVTANSGYNRAEDNLGGSVNISTGKVTVGTADDPVSIWNTLNSNFARVSDGGRSGGSLSAMITDNLRDSKNLLDLDFESRVELDQDNDADVANDVDVLGNSGHNKAKDNLDGVVDIDTGDVAVDVLVDTAANFNLADVQDCCLLDLTAKIDGNGRSSDNTLKLDFEDKLDVDQDNELDCDGGHGHSRLPKRILSRFPFPSHGKDNGKCSDVDVTGNTGDNKAEDNGSGGHDPSIYTGNADVSVGVNNSGNVNEFGSGDFELPSGDGEGTSVDIDLDFGGLMEILQDLLNLLG